MRIVAGRLRHRIIKETNIETTRETQDRIREAIFNALGPSILGKGLDLFCGSGAMALEGYSRGLNYIAVNDYNKKALDVAISNIKSLGITSYTATNLDYQVYLTNAKEAFDYIFLDPPYAYTDIASILTLVWQSKVSKNGTIVIFEMASLTKEVIPADYYKLIKTKTYGKKKVVFLEVIKCMI